MEVVFNTMRNAEDLDVQYREGKGFESFKLCFSEHN